MRAATGWWTARKPTSGVKQVKADCPPTPPPPLEKSETTDKSNKGLQRQGAVHLEESDSTRRTSASAAVQTSTSTEMDTNEFRRRGKEMVDYIADYLDTISKRRVTPAIEPGYLRHLIPSDPPNKAESWDQIMNDVETSIMPGVTHWQHPRFHAYFPAGNSYPSILGDMLGDAIGCVGFSWAASPACTELETIVLDWMGKMIGLPEEFLAFSEDSKGGGVIQTSASECVLVSMLAARAQTVRALKEQHPFVEEGVLLSKLMAYCSKEAHSSVEKAATVAFVKLRILETDEKCSLRGETLRLAMEEDRAMGLIPFFVSTTLGTTACCSFDNLAEIGPVCKEFGVWLHVDAAYAGNAFICPEFKYLMKGIEYAMSFNTNPNKWMLVNFDCSTMWVKDRFKLTQALVVDPLYLQHSYSDKAIDYRHWGIPLSRRFRSLKLWFVIRNYGVEGLQKYVREHCRLAKKFESLVRKDDRFEVVAQVILGLVCFRLKGSNNINQKLLSTINASGKLHMVPASVNDRYVIRFCVCAQHATDADILHAWQVISEVATDVTEYLVEPDNNKKIVEVTKENSLLDEEEEEEVAEELADNNLADLNAGNWESLFLGDGSAKVNEETLESCIRSLMASSGFDLDREESLISTCSPKSLDCCGKDGDFSPREFLKPGFFKQISIPEISNLSI